MRGGQRAMKKEGSVGQATEDIRMVCLEPS